jgi:hypothetical protein
MGGVKPAPSHLNRNQCKLLLTLRQASGDAAVGNVLPKPY